MVKKFNTLGRGVALCPDKQIRILLYADVIPLIAESEENMQDMFDLLGAWCQKWSQSQSPKE